MDLRGFDKSSNVTPLLVRLYDSHKFYGLVKDDKPLARAELTRAVTDLFACELTVNEQELLADVLIGLMRQAEKELRQALAERLASLPNVPLRLILHLANDDITVAAPVLRKSIVLNDLDLIYIVKSRDSGYWRAIAGRNDLGAEVIDSLAETRDSGTAVILSKNERITLTRHAMEILADMAQDDEAIARPLLMRPEIPQSLACGLYDYVGQELKNYIAAFYGGAMDALTETAVDSLILEFAEPEPVRAPEPEFLPTRDMLTKAREAAAHNLLNMDVIMETLAKGKVALFIALFAEHTGLPAKKVHDFLCQPCPKGMAIACRAFGVQKNDFSRIYLMTHRMRSKDRLVNHNDMLEVLRYFDKVRPEAARRIIEGGLVH